MHNQFKSPLFLSLIITLGACDQWVKLPPMPHSRVEHVAAVGHLGGGGERIFVFGGIVNGVSPHDDVYVDAFDTQTGVWDAEGTYPDMPNRHRDPAVATDNSGRIYVIGGTVANSVATSLVDVFDPATSTWSTIEGVPTPRKGAGATFGPDGKIYVIGGTDGPGGQKYNVVERYDPGTQAWESVAPLPSAHGEGSIGAATDCDGHIVVVGARTWLPNIPCVSNTYVYDIDTDEWTVKAPMPGCMAGSGVVRGPDGRIYAINDGDYFTSSPGDVRVYSYDPSEDEWREEASTNVGGIDLAAVSSGSNIFALGGANKYPVDPAVGTRFEYLGVEEVNPDCEAPGESEVRKGMTWQCTGVDVEHGVSLVGCAGCDPYAGDTKCDEERPVLCINDTGDAPNPGIDTDFYHGWSKGYLFATEPVVGLELTSLDAADARCAAEFGAGYRMAEFHDGGGGWNYWGYGSVPTGVRMWTYINDQDANCWGTSCDDGDSDGVCDDDDLCSATLPGAAVDTDGCAGGLVCNDGTISPSCTCEGSWQGCCSWHGGVAGCG